MADRYWVGGTGNWSDNTNHWSATSGGSPNASLPTSSDNVFIDSSSGLSGGTLTMNTAQTVQCNNFTSSTGHSYTIAKSGNCNFYGSVTLESGITFTGNHFINFSATTTGNTITTAGVIMTGGVSFLGVGGGWTLQDNFTTDDEFAQSNGTFNANGYNVKATDYYFPAYNTSDPIVNMGSGIWEATGNDAVNGDIWEVSERFGHVVTINPGTSTIKVSDSTSNTKTFVVFADATGKTYYNIWLTGSGTGAFIIQGSNTFNDFKCDTPPHTIQFTAGTTTTLSSFTVSGTSGNLITVTSITSSSHTLSKPDGIVTCSYLSLSYSTATGGAIWKASNTSTDGGHNSGWIFTNSQPFNQSKNTASLSNSSKNSASTSNTSKHSASASNQSKNTASTSNTSKHTSSISNKAKL